MLSFRLSQMQLFVFAVDCRDVGVLKSHVCEYETVTTLMFYIVKQ